MDSVRHAIGRFLRPVFVLLLCAMVVFLAVFLVIVESLGWRLRAVGLLLCGVGLFDCVRNYPQRRWRWFVPAGALISLAGFVLLFMELR